MLSPNFLAIPIGQDAAFCLRLSLREAAFRHDLWNPPQATTPRLELATFQPLPATCACQMLIIWALSQAPETLVVRMLLAQLWHFSTSYMPCLGRTRSLRFASSKSSRIRTSKQRLLCNEAAATRALVAPRWSSHHLTLQGANPTSKVEGHHEPSRKHLGNYRLCIDYRLYNFLLYFWIHDDTCPLQYVYLFCYSFVCWSKARGVWLTKRHTPQWCFKSFRWHIIMIPARESSSYSSNKAHWYVARGRLGRCLSL